MTKLEQIRALREARETARQQAMAKQPKKRGKAARKVKKAAGGRKP